MVSFHCFPSSGLCPRRTLGHGGGNVPLEWVKLDFTSFTTLAMTSMLTRSTKKTQTPPRRDELKTFWCSWWWHLTATTMVRIFNHLWKNQKWHVLIFVGDWTYTQKNTGQKTQHLNVNSELRTLMEECRKSKWFEFLPPCDFQHFPECLRVPALLL